jgi:anaerobic ribonucleoside-triphosphate reductase activating protein
MEVIISMKYTDFEVVLAEIPDEITLAINISNCPYHCPGCHSPHLWKDVGTVLSPWELANLIRANKGITCVAFMGGPFEEVAIASDLIHKVFPNLKTAWYTGASTLPIHNHSLNYIKIGRYVAELGPLNNPKTNQRLYRIDDLGHGGFKGMENITPRLWKNLK